jgi:2,3-bisphosphoglycerate-independent phosphoglycerate mutase
MSSSEPDLREIKNAIDANSKAIADLSVAISGLREETRVDFAKVEGLINNIETKLDGKIELIQSEMRTLDVKLEERTRIGFWGILVRGIPLLALAGVAIAFLLS